VITCGPSSKFGIFYADLHDALTLAKVGIAFEAPSRRRYPIVLQARKIRVIGLHQHIGSGIRDPAQYVEAVSVLLRIATEQKDLLEDLRYVNVGGGIGVPCECLQVEA